MTLFKGKRALCLNFNLRAGIALTSPRPSQNKGRGTQVFKFKAVSIRPREFCGDLLAGVQYVSDDVLGRRVARQCIDSQTSATLGRRSSYGGAVAYHLGKFAFGLDYCVALGSVSTSAQFLMNTSPMPSCIVGNTVLVIVDVEDPQRAESLSACPPRQCHLNQ